MKKTLNKIKKFRLIEKPFALPMRRFSKHNENNFCWEDWHEENKKNYPIKYFLQETLMLWIRVKMFSVENMKEKLIYKFFKKNHLLDIRNKNYSWGPCFHSDQIFYACFCILEDFVKNEMKNVVWYYPATKHHSEYNMLHTKKEILRLYNWWKTEYACDKFFDKKDYKKEIQYNLEKLISIRNKLTAYD